MLGIVLDADGKTFCLLRDSREAHPGVAESARKDSVTPTSAPSTPGSEALDVLSEQLDESRHPTVMRASSVGKAPSATNSKDEESFKRVSLNVPASGEYGSRPPRHGPADAHAENVSNHSVPEDDDSLRRGRGGSIHNAKEAIARTTRNLETPPSHARHRTSSPNSGPHFADFHLKRDEFNPKSPIAPWSVGNSVALYVCPNSIYFFYLAV